jgi:hypothetical protein
VILPVSIFYPNLAVSKNAVTQKLSFQSARRFHRAIFVASTFDKCAINLVIISFLLLALILGILEMSFIDLETYRAMIGLGAPIGMKQGWRMFGPDLRKTNWHTLVLIELEDGTIKAREMPRMEKLSQWERFAKEKERSFLQDRMAIYKYRRFWPSLARYYARANSDIGKGIKARRVTFILMWTPMPDPYAPPAKYTYRDRMPEHDNWQVNFVYRVTPQDLAGL